MSLAQLLTLHVEQERQVSECWRLDFKHLVQQNMFGCGRQPLLASNDVSYPHQVVVYNIRKMISWKPVTLHDNLVVNRVIVKYYFSMHQILKLGLSFWHEHPYHVWFTRLNTLPYCLFIQSMAKPIIFGFRRLPCSLFFTHLFKAFCRAEAVVGMATFDKCIAKFLVDS
jgi:hypothetical protein